MEVALYADKARVACQQQAEDILEEVKNGHPVNPGMLKWALWCFEVDSKHQQAKELRKYM